MGDQSTMASYTDFRRLNLIIFASKFLLMFGYKAIAVTGSPSQQVVISGSSTPILSCTTALDASVAFYFKPWTSTEDADEIFDRYDILNGYKSKFEVVRNGTKHYILETLNAEEWHAGQYSCYENNGIGDLLSTADVTIIDSELSCNYTRIDTSSVSLCCEIEYFGTSLGVDGLTSRWSWRESPTDGSLHQARLTKTESKLIAEIKVDLSTSSGSGASSTYVIFLGVECQNSQQFCPFLNQSIVVPFVPTSTVSDLAENFESTASIHINTNGDTERVVVAVAVSISVVLIGFVVIIICICYKKDSFKNKLYKILGHRKTEYTEIRLNRNSTQNLNSEANGQLF